jgi:sigma-B regulation protein RsbU (phosphoserine phosphatase)
MTGQITSQTASQATGAQTQGPRILVVDDNDDNRYTLTLYLNLEGYGNIEVAAGGATAIARLEREPFDLVLLDVMMPEIDGYQVLIWLKTQDHLRDLPIVMISSLNEMASVVRCIELGAVDYLNKPFDPVLLRARIGASLEKKLLRDEVGKHLARLETELAAARRLQQGMVPSSFPRPTPDNPVEIFASMEPAREVGGDLYDFFYSDKGTVWFLIGDVSGKGMAAALFMARAKSLIRLAAELMRGEGGVLPDPSDIIARVNRELCEDNGEMMFVALFLGVLATGSGMLRFCNAGHLAPYRISCRTLQLVEGAEGTVLGVDPDARYTSGQVILAPGDAIYLATDGVVEAANPRGDAFSEERLQAVLRDASARPSAEIVKSVGGAVRDFVGAAVPSDDVTMLAIRWLDRSKL